MVNSVRIDVGVEGAGEAASEVKGVGGAFDSLRDRVNSLLSGIGSVADNAFHALPDAAQGAMDGVRSVIDAAGVGADLERQFHTLGDSIGQALLDSKSKIEPAIRNALSSVGDVAQDQLQHTLEESFGLDAATSDRIARKLTGLFSPIGDTIADSIASKAGDLGGKLVDKVASSGIIEAVAPVMAGAGAAIGEAFDLAIAAAPVLLPALLLAAVVAAIAFLVTHPEIVTQAGAVGGQIVLGILGGLGDLGRSLLGGITDAIGWIVNNVGGLIQSANEIGTNIVSGIIEGLAGLGAQLVGAITSAFEAIQIDVGPFHISGRTGVTVDVPNINLPSLPSFAVGAWKLPQDTVAQVHKGEMIIPADVAGRLRGEGGGAAAVGAGAPVSDDSTAILARIEALLARHVAADSVAATPQSARGLLAILTAQLTPGGLWT